MKKVVAVLLSLVIAFSISAQALASAEKEIYPIILVPGFSSAGLYVENDDGTKTHVWGLDLGSVGDKAMSGVGEIIKGVGELTKGNAKYIADVLGQGLVEVIENMRCNPDGTSTYNVKTYVSSAAETNYTYLLANEDGNYMYEKGIMAMFGSYMGENWTDYIFNFSTDFRMSVIDCAENLNTYIDDVLEYTGAKKVNLYCVSHGGQVAATFLNLHGVEKADKIHNVVMTIPAIGGSPITYGLFTGDVKLDEENLLGFVEYAQMLEEDYHWLLSSENLDFVDDIIHYILPYVQEILQYWGSLWDFVPYNEYDAIRDSYLDPIESAALIEKSDRFHHEIYPTMGEKLRECEAAGINISIVAGTGNKDIIGYEALGDAILSTNSSTGSVCAPYGERFSDGYQTLNTVCKDASHNHLSPSMEIDASTGYLPETTWYIDGMYHGMTVMSDYGTELVKMLMFSEDRVDVHTYSQFSQFHADSARSNSVFAKLNNSTEGYVSDEDTALIIENCSKKYPIKIISVSCNSADISFDVPFMKEIAVGESVEIPLKSQLPTASGIKTEITVNYVLVGSLTPIGSRSFDFTIMNGEKAEYNPDVPTVDVDPGNDSVLDGLLSFVSNLGVQKLITMFYNIAKSVVTGLIREVLG